MAVSIRGTVARALDVGRAELGTQEVPVNKTKYGEYRHQDGEAWCVNFVAWVLAEAGVPGWDDDSPFPGGYTPTLAAYGKSTGTWWTDPADASPGDVVLYQWPTLPKGRYGHTGIVEATEPGGIIAIEGNTNPGGVSRTGGGVYRVRRHSNIAGGFTPDYRPEPDPIGPPPILPAPKETDKMPQLMKGKNDPTGQWWITDGITKRAVTGDGDTLVFLGLCKDPRGTDTSRPVDAIPVDDDFLARIPTVK